MLRIWAKILRTQYPFARNHRWSLLLGSIAAVFVVGIRLSIPRVFHTLLEPWLTGTGPESFAGAPSYARMGLLFGGLVCTLFAALGLADHWERLQFARFAIGTVRDLRQAASRAALSTLRRGQASGDLVARLIGDTARMKAGIKGFLVHVATNGLLYVGATVILLTVNIYLGLLLVVAGLAIAAVTWYGAVVVFELALKHRSREGEMALSLEQKLAGTKGKMRELREHNATSGGFEAELTRAIGRTTFAAHTIYGIAVVSALTAGVLAITANRLSVSDMALFLLYALILRPPIVQLTRQGCRTGKILACAVRIDEILASGIAAADTPRLSVLQNGIQLKDIRVKGAKTRTRKSRLSKIDLTVPVGSQLLILGGPGSGKTTLLQVLCGEVWPTRGEFFWDGTLVPQHGRMALTEHVHYCSGAVVQWKRQRLRKWLGAGAGTSDDEIIHVLEFCGAWSIVRNLASGLATKIASTELSSGERASLALAKAVLSPQSLLLLDDPLLHISNSRKDQILRSVLSYRKKTTVVYATRRLTALDLFHQVLHLRKGKLIAEDLANDFIPPPDV